MSYNVWPSFTGRGWNIKKRPVTKTILQEAVSGAQYATQQMQYPLYEFDVEIPYLSQADFNTLVGFYNFQGGPFTPFYFSNDSDNAVVSQFLGVGNGSNKVFTIVKNDGTNWGEPVQGINGTPTFKVNSTVTAGTVSGAYPYTVTFASAPASGANVFWTGNYYYLVRFKDDSQIETNQLANQMYEVKTITLRTAR